MIKIVDKNGDGKISYSEFRVMMGAFPLLIPEDWFLLHTSLLIKYNNDVVFDKIFAALALHI